jgi:hypothetical protein
LTFEQGEIAALTILLNREFIQGLRGNLRDTA